MHVISILKIGQITKMSNIDFVRIIFKYLRVAPKNISRQQTFTFIHFNNLLYIIACYLSFKNNIIIENGVLKIRTRKSIMRSLNTNMRSLPTIMRSLNTNMRSLPTTMWSHNTIMRSLPTTMRSHNTNIWSLPTTMRSLNTNMRSLSTTLRSLNTNMCSLPTTMSSTKLNTIYKVYQT